MSLQATPIDVVINIFSADPWNDLMENSENPLKYILLCELLIGVMWLTIQNWGPQSELEEQTL